MNSTIISAHIVYATIAIIKARQLGFSTLLALICLDMLLFTGGFLIGIVDMTADDAFKKLSKCKFAYERLPADVKACFEIRDTVAEFEAAFADYLVVARMGGHPRKPPKERRLGGVDLAVRGDRGERAGQEPESG